MVGHRLRHTMVFKNSSDSQAFIALFLLLLLLFPLLLVFRLAIVVVHLDDLHLKGLLLFPLIFTANSRSPLDGALA